MVVTKRILSFLIGRFCHPKDPVKLKREQCILVFTSFFMLVIQLFNAIALAVTGLLLKSSWNVLVAFLGLMGILIHCRVTRRPKSARFLFLLLIYYNVHAVILRGGLLFTPMTPFVGLIAPILSAFLSPYPLESGGWLAVWLITNVCLAYLQTGSTNFLQYLETNARSQQMQNGISLVWLALLYIMLFWFVVHVYVLEAEVRFSAALSA